MRFSVLILSLLALACEGPVGPHGPEGAQGPRGERGPQGERAFETIDSVILEFDRSDVALNGNHGQITFNVHEINAAVIEEGAVVAFIDTSAGWTALPQAFIYAASDVSGNVRVGYTLREGQFVLTYSTNGPELLRTYLPDGQLKLVVISAG